MVDDDFFRRRQASVRWRRILVRGPDRGCLIFFLLLFVLVRLWPLLGGRRKNKLEKAHLACENRYSDFGEGEFGPTNACGQIPIRFEATSREVTKCVRAPEFVGERS